jgi:hypothetical protein
MPKKKTPFGKKGRKSSPPAVRRVYRSPEQKKLAPRTRPLPGLEDERIDELSDLALSCLDAHEEKKAAGEAEKAKKDELIACMKQRGLTRYRDSESDLLVELELSHEKVKVYTGVAVPKEKAEEEDRPIGEGTMETAPAAAEVPE